MIFRQIFFKKIPKLRNRPPIFFLVKKNQWRAGEGKKTKKN